MRLLLFLLQTFFLQCLQATVFGNVVVYIVLRNVTAALSLLYGQLEIFLHPVMAFEKVDALCKVSASCF